MESIKGLIAIFALLSIIISIIVPLQRKYEKFEIMKQMKQMKQSGTGGVGGGYGLGKYSVYKKSNPFVPSVPIVTSSCTNADQPSGGVHEPDVEVVTLETENQGKIMPGGMGKVNVQDEDVKQAAEVAVTKINNGEQRDRLDASGNIFLVSIKSAFRQTVAGTLYEIFMTVKDTYGKVFDIRVIVVSQIWMEPSKVWILHFADVV